MSRCEELSFLLSVWIWIEWRLISMGIYDLIEQNGLGVLRGLGWFVLAILMGVTVVLELSTGYISKKFNLRIRRDTRSLTIFRVVLGLGVALESGTGVFLILTDYLQYRAMPGGYLCKFLGVKLAIMSFVGAIILGSGLIASYCCRLRRVKKPQ